MDWSIVQSSELNFSTKLFSNKLTKGQAALYKKNINESLLFRFDAKDIPYLGLWLCYGGWPKDGLIDHCTIALEPTNVRSDALGKTLIQDKTRRIKPQQTHKWELKLSFILGRAIV